MNDFTQVEIISDLPEDKTITVYRCGPLVDLCRGPHIPNTSFVKAFACLKVLFKPLPRYLVRKKIQICSGKQMFSDP